MVRISIPTLPNTPPLPPSALTRLSLKDAAAHLSTFLTNGKGKTVILSGAGVSVDSGIRAYRGPEGHYSNPNYKWVDFWNDNWITRKENIWVALMRVDLYCIMNWLRKLLVVRCLEKDVSQIRYGRERHQIYWYELFRLGEIFFRCEFFRLLTSL